MTFISIATADGRYLAFSGKTLSEEGSIILQLIFVYKALTMEGV